MNDNSNSHQMEPALTASEVAAILGLRPSTLAKWRKSGEGPPVHKERRCTVTYTGESKVVLQWVYPAKTLREWTAEHRPHQVDALLAIRSEV